MKMPEIETIWWIGLRATKRDRDLGLWREIEIFKCDGTKQRKLGLRRENERLLVRSEKPCHKTETFGVRVETFVKGEGGLCILCISLIKILFYYLI